MKPIGILFDLDGTLLDTEFISELAIQEIVKKYNKDLNFTLRKSLLGRPSHEWTRMVINTLELQENISPEEFAIQWENNMHTLFSEMKEIPGALLLLKQLKEAKIPLALATSSTSNAVAMKQIYHQEIFSYFTVIVCGNDPEMSNKHGKPAPDIFLLAAKRLYEQVGDPEVDWKDVNRKEFIVVEDSINGVIAGKSAGMKVFALPDTRIYTEEEERKELFSHADIILTSLGDFNIEDI